MWAYLWTFLRSEYLKIFFFNYFRSFLIKIIAKSLFPMLYPTPDSITLLIVYSTHTNYPFIYIDHYIIHSIWNITWLMTIKFCSSLTQRSFFTVCNLHCIAGCAKLFTLLVPAIIDPNFVIFSIYCVSLRSLSFLPLSVPSVMARGLFYNLL